MSAVRSLEVFAGGKLELRHLTRDSSSGAEQELSSDSATTVVGFVTDWDIPFGKRWCKRLRDDVCRDRRSSVKYWSAAPI